MSRIRSQKHLAAEKAGTMVLAVNDEGVGIFKGMCQRTGLRRGLEKRKRVRGEDKALAQE